MQSVSGEQLQAISEMLGLANGLGVKVWLRGGWAMDFYLGRVTREHVDIDWFALADDASKLSEAMLAIGFCDVTAAPRGQQIDMVRGRVDHGIALVRLGSDGSPLVAGGPWAGEPWPTNLLDEHIGQIGELRAPIISPEAQIEIKQKLPEWNPTLVRRQKDLDDIALIHAQLVK